MFWIERDKTKVLATIVGSNIHVTWQNSSIYSGSLAPETNSFLRKYVSSYHSLAWPHLPLSTSAQWWPFRHLHQAISNMELASAEETQTKAADKSLVLLKICPNSHSVLYSNTVKTSKDISIDFLKVQRLFYHDVGSVRFGVSKATRHRSFQCETTVQAAAGWEGSGIIPQVCLCVCMCPRLSAWECEWGRVEERMSE